MEVIIKVKIDDTVLNRMRKGEYVQGSLHYDEFTGEKQFNAYVRKSRMPGYMPECKTLAELDNGWLKQHQTDRQEITDLLSIVERDLADAEISALSVDWRFLHDSIPQHVQAPVGASAELRNYRDRPDLYTFQKQENLPLKIVYHSLSSPLPRRSYILPSVSLSSILLMTFASFA